MNGAMAVALYFYRLGGAGGGAERMVCQLAGALVKRGFEVHLISWDAKDAVAFYPIHPGVRWTKLGFAPGHIDKLRRVKALHEVFRQHDIKVLVGFVMSGDRTVFAAAKLAGVRLVAAERNAPEMYHFRSGPLRRWATFRLLALADHIAVQMETYASGYPRYLHGRIVTIPNPVPIAQHGARPHIADETGGFTVLAVSRLDPVQKRIGCLIGAFSLVAEQFPHWHLRIIGDGPEEASLYRLINECGLAGRVSIEQSTPAVFEAYSQSHLFAIPSRWEGFPNALAEAMSHGLPAVGFAQSAGVAELIGPDGGWLAEGLDDEAALAAALACAMANGEERLRRGRSAARLVSQFAPDRQFDRWAELIRTLTRN
jgi:GalNAc-alpha-(1->4)-GalNAc-alpha-(1->3)-diNAcBac-PP-undecaprenol alpha-1,4-N-acetyl-D-galactosaminyltransferase